MSRGKRHEASDWIERGHSVAETARMMGVSKRQVRAWWSQLHPNLPIHEPGPDVRMWRFVSSWARKATVATWECPYCGGLVEHVVHNNPVKPWHCEWCGREVK